MTCQDISQLSYECSIQGFWFLKQKNVKNNSFEKLNLTLRTFQKKKINERNLSLWIGSLGEPRAPKSAKNSILLLLIIIIKS